LKTGWRRPPVGVYSVNFTVQTNTGSNHAAPYACKESGITVTGTSPRLMVWRGEACLSLFEHGLVRIIIALLAFFVPLAMLSMLFSAKSLFC